MERVRLEELCHIVVGRTPSRAEPRYWGGDHHWLSIADMTGQPEIRRTKERLSDEGAAVMRDRIAVPGTVLLSFKLSIGKVSIARVPVFTNEAIAALPIRDESRLDGSYLAHYLAYADLTGGADRAAMGNTLNIAKLRAIEIPVPPLPDQRRIAALLDEVESIRHARTTAIEQLDLVEESILQAVLDRTNGSRRRVQFGEIVESSQLGLVRGSSDFGAVGEFGYLRMDAITRSGRVDLRLVQRTDADARELARAELSDGDLLFNTRNSRELVGKSAVFYGPSRTLFNNNILRVRFKEDVSPAYIAAMLRTGDVKSQLEARKRGTTSVFAVYYRDLASIELEIPSSTEMDAFEMGVRRVQEIRLASERALKLTDQLKAALHAKAFKGEL